jgi:hypothetical protein
MILSDNETKADLLNYEAVATTIVSLLRHRPDRPMTVSLIVRHNYDPAR